MLFFNISDISRFSLIISASLALFYPFPPLFSYISHMSSSLEIDERAFAPRLKSPFRCFGRLGNCYCFLVTSNGEPWVCIGPDWPIFLFLLSFLLAIGCAFVLFMAPMAPSSVQIPGALVITLVIGCFLITALKNPGIALPQYLDPEVSPAFKSCARCGALAQENTFHCPDCNLCIRNYDHHCAFTGKCIGEGNILFFYAFLGSIVLFVIYLAVWGMFVVTPSKE